MRRRWAKPPLSPTIWYLTTMKTHVGAALLLTLVLWPGQAHLSQVHYESISLEQLVARSEIIVVATPAGDAKTTKVAVGKDAPPFSYSQRPYRVSDVLKGSLSAKDKKRLWVAGANLTQQFSLHKRYYIDKVSKSPIYERYEAATPVGSGPRLLFLRRTEFQGRPKMIASVFGAEEQLAQRAAVEALVNKPR